MSGEWRTMTLRAAGVSLFDCDHRTPPAEAEGLPYVAIPQLRHGRIDVSDARRITEGNFQEWTRKTKPTPYDVVLSRRCNPGETAFVAEGDEFALGQNLVLLRADGETVHPPFLRWLARSPGWWEQVEKYLNVGAVFDSLRCADVPNFELLIPPKDEQVRIANALGALDNRVQLNIGMSDTLIQVASTLFTSYFISFDPVRAKVEKRDTQLPALVAECFPDDFSDSELGPIPLGWEVKGLDQIAEFLNGLALQKFPQSGERFLPAIKIAQLRSGTIESADRVSADIAPDFVVKDGEVLFSWSGSLECKVWVGGRGALNQHLFKVTPNGVPAWLCYFGIHEHLSEFRRIAEGKATTMGHIQRRHLSEAKLALPPGAFPSAIDEQIRPIFEQAWKLRQGARFIAELRDSLLPRLLSGELPAAEAEELHA